MPALFRTNIGAQLIGTYINMVLYTLEIVQFYHYFRKSGRARDDRLAIKLSVIFNVSIDTLSTLASCATIYLYTIIFWGNSAAIGREYWPIVTIIALTGTGTFVVQSFMLYRYWKMTTHRIIVSLIFVLMVVALVGTYLTAIITFSRYSISDRNRGIPLVVVGLGGAAVCDVSITVLLVWQLYKIETENQEMKSLLRRISALAIKTGLASSIVGCGAAIAFIAAPHSQISDAILITLGRVYTCTMLFTLNNRGNIRGDTWVRTADGFSACHASTQQMASITFAPLDTTPNRCVAPPPKIFVVDCPQSSLDPSIGASARTKNSLPIDV